MHIHVPKPIHGWVQFFNEIAVIAIGIMIALSGEELLASWRERHTAEKSFEAVKDEVEVNLGRMQARLTTQDCIDRRLNEIAAYVERPEGKKRPSWVGRPQVWTMQTSAVAAARSYGSLTVLSREDQMAISTIYGSMAGFAEIENDEQWAWAELRSIAEDRDLTDSDKAALRESIQRARYASWRLNADATQAIQEAQALKIVPAKIGNGSQSVCIPMNTPFDEAVRKSSKLGYGEPHERNVVRPSRSRWSQRHSISAATTARPVASPVQMPTPRQSSLKASQLPIPRPTPQ